MIKSTIYRAISLQECARILDIKAGYTQDELRKAYLDKVKQSHPDKAGGDSQEFKKIAEAYYILKNSQVRLERSPEIAYDWTQQKQQFQHQNIPAPISKDTTEQTDQTFQEVENGYQSKDLVNLAVFGFGLISFGLWNYLTHSYQSERSQDITEASQQEKLEQEGEFIVNQRYVVNSKIEYK